MKYEVGQTLTMNIKGKLLKIIKEAEDPICKTRVSAGGVEGIGFYLAYRGDIKDVKEVLELVLEAVNKL